MSCPPATTQREPLCLQGPGFAIADPCTATRPCHHQLTTAIRAAKAGKPTSSDLLRRYRIQAQPWMEKFPIEGATGSHAGQVCSPGMTKAPDKSQRIGASGTVVRGWYGERGHAPATMLPHCSRWTPAKVPGICNGPRMSPQNMPAATPRAGAGAERRNSAPFQPGLKAGQRAAFQPGYAWGSSPRNQRRKVHKVHHCAWTLSPSACGPAGGPARQPHVT